MTRRALVLVAAATLAIVVLAGAPGGPALAVEDEDTTTTTRLLEGDGATGDIIPRPGSGTPPAEAGDRGGAGQVGVFIAVCVGLLVIFGLALRQVRRAQARRGPRPGEP